MKSKTVIREHLDHFEIAGFTYYEGVTVFNELKIGAPLEFALDENNAYDARAVKLFFNGVHIGFIPKNCNRIFYKLLKTGCTNIEMRIQRISPEENPENQVGVVAHLVSNA